jgi:macrodomain Ter protein organizer (MatP/YcbG family)
MKEEYRGMKKPLKKNTSIGRDKQKKEIKANTEGGKLQKHIKLPSILALKLRVISARYSVGMSKAFENMVKEVPFPDNTSITEKEMVTLNLDLDVAEKLTEMAKKKDINVNNMIAYFIDKWQPK